MTDGRHILFINEFFHPDICASATVAADHLPRIRKLLPDHKITVIAGRRAWHDPSILYLPTETYQGINIIRVNRPAIRRRSLFRRAWGFVAFQRGVLRAARTVDRIDLVIATTAPPQGAHIARKIARKHGCPYIYKVLDLYPDLAVALGRMSERSLLFRYWLAKDIRAMRESVGVVAIAQGIADRIARTRRIEAHKLLTIHDGFDPTRLHLSSNPPSHPSVDVNTFRREHNPDGRFVVQYAGNMGLSHPFETIMEACNRLADRDDMLFQFIGDGPGRSYIQAHLPPNGQLMDYQPTARLGEMLSTADVCLISQHDAMYDKALPYKVYGILAASKPVIFIGSNRSEIAEWLSKYHAGACVDPSSANDLTATILKLKNDHEAAREMGQSARQLLDDEFLSQKAVEKWAELINQIMEMKTAP